MTQLAKYVKEMRKQFGLTQVDLSQKIGGRPCGLCVNLNKERKPSGLIRLIRYWLCSEPS